MATYLRYEPTGKNKWGVRIDGRKVGQIKKQRGRFVATLSRTVGTAALSSICAFVGELDKGFLRCA